MNETKKINVVLAGQGNTGKTSVFNYFTGSHQHTGNWAGKTIEKLEGTLYYKDYTIDVLDLPGIYSLTTLSVEELIAREYIIKHKPDVVINIVDSTNLERNLIFTLQLLELGCRVIVALNMIDIARKKGITIDIPKLQNILNTPVTGTVASRGTGLTDLMDKVIELREVSNDRVSLNYGKEIEDCISQLTDELKGVQVPYPERWIAIKLLEKDNEIVKIIRQIKPEVLEKNKLLEEKLEEIHGHDSSLVIADERSHLAAQITRETVTMAPHRKMSLNDRLDFITTNRFSGYLVMILIAGGMFFTVFSLGNWLSSLLDSLFIGWHEWWNNTVGTSFLSALGWSAIEGVLALIQIALPYILPFYIILYFLEEWGYIARISFLMDNFMHKMGIHGKGCISFIIGLGCNVPGCLSCRIMESRRERFITAVLVTLVPCSAVSVIVFGLVGKYVGLIWALGLYVFAMILIFIAGKISSKILPGEPVELIMPMPDYKTPQLKSILYQTWDSLKEFIYIAAPIVIVSGIIIQAINLAGWMPAISSFLSPVTVSWLGLPAITGILLIFGILRKELILVMLAAYLGTTEFAEVLTSQQMITLAVVSMFYVPCVATISVLWKDFGWKKALAVCIIEIVFAIVLAGIVTRLLNLVF
ncbi:MAG TPA: ferrous iron transport protein B [Bacteroidales bacterium]|nr:ferrous iron transport protein B [Bacteroidales bacterium]HOX74201.1 ferrous iron transport protein B [Bacteroidales bacterium]HPM87670.1 ferrous iron transport protein B [Bacteroidales bacterium]HQM69733.1 ferrous iron transport protein B [Bacteroidales bacterium]